jgi:hypothetical protein
MHPSFGIEFTCTSTKWEDVMKGPSREAVLAHSYKVLHYRSLFGSGEVTPLKADIQPPRPEDMLAGEGEPALTPLAA